MFIADLLFALACTLLVIWIVSFVFGTRGPWGSLLWFYIVVALFAWSGGAWLMPFGPVWRGIGWLPIIFMAVMASLLLTAASPRTYRRRPPESKEQAVVAAESRAAVDVFFWVVIICLLVFGTSHYYWYPRIR